MTMSAAAPASSPRPGVLLEADRVAETSQGPRLKAGRCGLCDLTAFPAPRQCPSCWGRLADLPLSGTGVLYSYSVVHIPVLGHPNPYGVAYVDMPEGARVFAHLHELDETSIACDTRVQINLALQAGGDYRLTCQPTSPEADHA